MKALYPVRYRRCEFRCDGGGPGAWRGGTGVEYEIDIHTEGTWSFRGEGLRYKSGYGAASGMDGEGGEMRVHPAEAPKLGLRELAPARLVVSSPEGGGFGDPLDRDPRMGAPGRARRCRFRGGRTRALRRGHRARRQTSQCRRDGTTTRCDT